MGASAKLTLLCGLGALVYFATTAICHAAVALSATCTRRGYAALTDADGKGRELLLQFVGVALRTFRRLCAKQDCLKLVATGFATVFENRHEGFQLSAD
jgi:hypothetical protein